MPKFTKRKDGRMQTEIKIGGKRVFFYGKTERELMEKIMAFRKNEENGPEFRDVAEEWWQKKQPSLSPNSLRNYTPAVERAIEAFGDVRVRNITPASVESFIENFGMTHAAKTTATQLNIINQIIRYARMQGFCDTVATDIVQIPRGLKRTTRLLPSESDVAAVRAHLDYPIMGLFAYILLYSGLRRGEALALQYKDIDIENKKIHVQKSLCAYRNEPIIKQPKTEAGYRDVPLVDALIAAIPDGKPNDYIFLRDGHLITDADFDTLWGWYRRDTGITATPHQLRHQFATLLYDAGIDKFEAARYMGHTTAQMTEIYTHISRSRSVNSLNRLNSTINRL